MLDTNIISDLVRNPDGAPARRIERAGQRNICTSVIVAAELRYGCAKKGFSKLLARVESLLETIPSYRWTFPPMPNMAASAPSWRQQA